jgi:uncharacterized protein YlxW (UPF0749 family)
MTNEGAPTSPYPGPDVPVGSGRARLRSALWPRLTRGSLVAGVLCAVLGFAAAVQVRANQGAGLSGLRQADLVRILDDASERSARLQAEARDLETSRDKVTNGTDGARAALEEARNRLRTLGILAGTLPASGPGIEFTVTDDSGAIEADVLLDALQELRDAGAEAVELSTVGGARVRVVAGTSLVDVAGKAGVNVDGTRLTSPYRFGVIGDGRTLAAALDIPGGVLDVLRQHNARGDVTQLSSLTISSLRPTPTPEYARPAPEQTGN